jgi:cytochrome b involved in lipid metabolism
VGEAINVDLPTKEIQAHIDNTSWYAPNAEILWLIYETGEWNLLSTDPVNAGISQVTLKYLIQTDCGSVESNELIIDLQTTSIKEQEIIASEVRKIIQNEKVWILRNGKCYTPMGAEVDMITP